MTTRARDAWDIGRAYEPYVGGWSRLVAAEFLRWLPSDPPLCGDAGCGTGALTHAVLATEKPIRVLGVEPSDGFAAAARAAIDDPRFEVRSGTAAAIPARDGEFDRVVSALVLNFIRDPAEGLGEMRRVTRPGGMIAGYVWDYAEGMQMIRTFWDVASELDQAAGDLDEGTRFPLCRPEPVGELLSAAGLAEVRVHPLQVPTMFHDFDDFLAAVPRRSGARPRLLHVAARTRPHGAAGRARFSTAPRRQRAHPVDGPSVGLPRIGTRLTREDGPRAAVGPIARASSPSRSTSATSACGYPQLCTQPP
jgi:SAM-dependent methyltransferase